MHDSDIPSPSKPVLVESDEQIYGNNLLVKAMYLQDKKDKSKTSQYAEFYMIPKVVMYNLDLSAYSKLVFSAILGHVRKGGRGKCNPGTECLATECGISFRQVAYSLDELKDNGWINWKNTGRIRSFRIYSPPEQDSSQANKHHAQEEKFNKNTK
jgi:hypothetical protein